jgi:hypothetical protein
MKKYYLKHYNNKKTIMEYFKKTAKFKMIFKKGGN